MSNRKYQIHLRSTNQNSELDLINVFDTEMKKYPQQIHVTNGTKSTPRTLTKDVRNKTKLIKRNIVKGLNFVQL